MDADCPRGVGSAAFRSSAGDPSQPPRVMAKHQIAIKEWRDSRDLAQLRIYFYAGNDRVLRKAGCDTVALWTLQGRAPHPVTATADLTQAMLDQMSSAIPTTTRINNFCTAWVRFVNGMTDIQQQYRTKQSMYQVARQLSMPASFIELRHRVVHEDRPTLHELSRAARQGLNWLFHWYWTHVVDDETLTTKHTAYKLDGLLFEHADSELQQSLQTMLEKNTPPQTNQKAFAAEPKILDAASIRRSVELVRQLCQTSWERMRSAGYTLCAMLFAVRWATTNGQPLGINPMAPFRYQDNVAFHVYNDLLLRIASRMPHFILILQDAFFACLMLPESDQSEGVSRAVVIWLHHLYASPVWRKYRSSGVLDPEVALQLCVDNPGPWTNQLISLLYQNPDFADFFQNSAMQGANIWQDREISETIKPILESIAKEQVRLDPPKPITDKELVAAKRPYGYSEFEMEKLREKMGANEVQTAFGTMG